MALAGITVLQDAYKNEESFTIFVLAKDLIGQELSSFLAKIKKDAYQTIILMQDKKVTLKKLPNELLNLEIIDLAEYQNYYSSFFILLKKLLPNLPLDKLINNFNEKYKNLHIESLPYETTPPKNVVDKKKPSNSFIHQSRPHILSIVLCIGITISGLLAFYWYKGNKVKNISISSDLIIPKESVFLNRPTLIAEIDDKLNKTKELQTIALIGPGGAGKTTLARQYGHLQNIPVVWEINAETPETLYSSFENLAYNIARDGEEKKFLRALQDVKDPQERKIKLIAFVKKMLKGYSSWLLIYDNLETITDIQEYFPFNAKAWGQGKVILTTRNATIKNNSYIEHVLQIEELTQAEKLALFIKIIRVKDKNLLTASHKEKDKIFLENIPSFPLDVSIAAYYLNATNTSYEEYLKHLSQSTKTFTILQGEIFKDAQGYTRTRYDIITLSVNKIVEVDPVFKELLLLLCLLDSQNIPKDLLEAYKGKLVVDNFIYHLKKYSLITQGTFDRSHLSIHRNIQDLSLNYLINTFDLEKRKKLFRAIDNVLENYINQLIEKDKVLELKQLINHCKRFLSHDDLLNEEITGLIVGKLGIIHYLHGNDATAKKLLEKSLVIIEPYIDKNFNQIATYLAYLGNAHKDLGHYGKAKTLLERSLAIYNKYLPKNHPSTAWVLIYLGNIYRKLGHYQRAQNVLENCLTILKENHSEEHIVFWALENMGVVYRCLGDYERARSILEDVLRFFKKNNPSHMDIAWILENLGVIYREIGDYKKSKSILEESLLVYKQHFNENYVYVGRCLFQLGITYTKLKQYKKARSFLEKSLLIHKNEFGKDHIETARIIREFGHIYLAKGNLESAKKYFYKALLLFEKNNHPDIYMIYEDLADVCLQKREEIDIQDKERQNFNRQAKYYFYQALKVLKSYFPSSSPHEIRIQSKLKRLCGS